MLKQPTPWDGCFFYGVYQRLDASGVERRLILLSDKVSLILTDCFTRGRATLSS